MLIMARQKPVARSPSAATGAGAESAGLFAAEGGEDDGALGLEAAAEDAGKLEEHGHAAGVVVGTGMDLALVAPTDVADSQAEVVVVGADDDALALPLRPRAGNDPDNVPLGDRFAIGAFGGPGPEEAA